MSRRALVVDDEADMCELIQAVLSTSGIVTRALTDSAEAAGYLQKEKFDVVFLDLHMPPPDGFELARQMRRSGFNQMTPIIMITGDGDPSVLSQGFQAGASFFLYKPIDRGRLLKLMRATQGTIEQERRRFQRVTVRRRVQIKSGKDEFEGHTVDVSLNGILVEASSVLPVGSPVQVALHLSPEVKPVVGSGFIVRIVGGKQMGIHLSEMGIKESERLQEFLLPLILTE